MIRAHAAAVLARLRSDLHLTVYDEHVPALPDLPYVVLWTAAPRRTSDRATAVPTNADWWCQTTTVGISPEQVRLVQEHVHDCLLGVRLTIPGRNTTAVTHRASPPMQRDDDVTPPLFVGVDQWGLFSTPA